MNAFDMIISSLIHEQPGGGLIGESLCFDAKTMDKIPLRYRIIALGFVRKMGVEELNRKLEENGCAKLYVRSLWEAGLYYAFLHRLSYEEWKKLQEKCEILRESIGKDSPFFSNSKITLRDLREYVLEGSDEEDQILATRHLTKAMERRIAEASAGKGGFEAFFAENIRSFSFVREKARYYFCKYLYYVLTDRIEKYVDARSSGVSADKAAEILSMFQGITPLSRKKYSPEEMRGFLNGCAISCGEIFDEFNYFFFGYVDMDWIDVTLDYYGSFEAVPDDEQRRIAGSLRRQNPAKYKNMTDAEIIEAKKQELTQKEAAENEAYSLSGNGKGYQKNRAGENTVRKYIRGTLDLDRTALICFLLFFGELCDLPESMKINEKRLSQILLSCGFPGLRVTDDLDLFVLGYLDADDRVDYLMEQVTNYALADENFYLYNFYRNSVSYHEEFEKIIDTK